MTGLCTHDLTRRSLLGAAGSLFAWTLMPRRASAAGTRDYRFLTIVLRGGMDGLSMIAPIGDPAYRAMRGEIALTADGDHAAVPLDGFFYMHPAMPSMADLYRRGEVLVFHAAASPYRERSHFDGQEVLESGQPTPGLIASGWMNRLASVVDPGARISPADALAVGIRPPLIMQGSAPIVGWAPTRIAAADDELARRVGDLYTHTDPALAAALSLGLHHTQVASGEAAGQLSEAARVVEGAAKILARPDGPRLAALAVDGWDLHAQNGAANGRMATALSRLDETVRVLRETLGSVWADTAVLVVTEFGRTVRVNGSSGTDHGTATVALLLGGAVNGGRVIADWPGLRQEDLRDNRDLRPTIDIRSIAMSAARDLLGVPESRLTNEVFPGAHGIASYRDLIA